ncbi:hypothetical protein [Accumulibacter sp.]|nr:hypothetical protein [Accumulibacter sp.]
MDSRFSVWGGRGLLAFTVLLLAACAGYSGSNLQPGVATLADVVASMG